MIHDTMMFYSLGVVGTALVLMLSAIFCGWHRVVQRVAKINEDEKLRLRFGLEGVTRLRKAEMAWDAMLLGVGGGLVFFLLMTATRSW